VLVVIGDREGPKHSTEMNGLPILWKVNEEGERNANVP
jgi:hypothetical protein